MSNITEKRKQELLLSIRKQVAASKERNFGSKKLELTEERLKKLEPELRKQFGF